MERYRIPEAVDLAPFGQPDSANVETRYGYGNHLLAYIPADPTTSIKFGIGRATYDAAQEIRLQDRLLQDLTARSKPTSAYPLREYWLDIERLDDVERARIEFAEPEERTR